LKGEISEEKEKTNELDRKIDKLESSNSLLKKECEYQKNAFKKYTHIY
jgi:hypothetical protein